MMPLSLAILYSFLGTMFTVAISFAVGSVAFIQYLVVLLRLETPEGKKHGKIFHCLVRRWYNIGLTLGFICGIPILYYGPMPVYLSFIIVITLICWTCWYVDSFKTMGLYILEIERFWEYTMATWAPAILAAFTSAQLVPQVFDLVDALSSV